MRPLLRQIVSLSRTTLIENIRNKALTVLILTGVILLFASLVLANMAIGDSIRVITNSGFWILGIYGLITTLFLGLNAIQEDIRKKSIYMLFSRPVNRYVYLIGKFVGTACVCLVVHAFLTTAFLLLLRISGGSLTTNFLIALAFILLEWMVLAGFSILFATFTSPLLHSFFLISIYFIGHWAKYLYTYAQNIEDIYIQKLLVAIYYLFPNLEALNFRGLALYSGTADSGLIFQCLLTGLCWLAATLFSATLLFNRRQLL
jgi:Cu-processing system permease protein